MKIGMVLLGEAGNYGDDLILLAVLHAIGKHDPESEVSFLSFGNEIPLYDTGSRLKLPKKLHRAKSTRDLPGSRWLQRQFRETDVMLVGGGGLIQTSQHALKPFQWLRHLPETPVPVVGIGLGIGPLSTRWRKFFNQHPSPFDFLYVRELYSQTLAKEFGWNPNLANDFIDETFIKELTGDSPDLESDHSLGVALRAWPGLSAQDTATHISDVARRHNIETVSFFVLESKNGAGPDVDFTRAVADLVNLPTKDLHIYSSSNIMEFTRAMHRPSVAISMKLHSSALWGARKIPIYPIIYAPKISDYFGLPYAGLSMIREATEPAPPISDLRSEDALLNTLKIIDQTEEFQDPRPRQLFTRWQRTLLQSEGLLINSMNKAKRIANKGK